MGIFGFLAGPLGWLLRLVYSWVNDYFLAIFLFTLITRLIMFPLSLQQQKKQADRIRLAPRLERLQKKYKQDPRKLQEKQQALYEKEGVSMTGGCLPMIVQMIVLFGIIAVIYEPLAYLSTVGEPAIESAMSAVNVETYMTVDKDGKKVGTDGYTLNEDATKVTYSKDGVEYTVDLTTKLPSKDVVDGNYYREMNLMKAMEKNEVEIIRQMMKDLKLTEEQAQAKFQAIAEMKTEFQFGDYSLLETPWGEKGFGNINILWLIPLFSGITAICSSILSSYYSKQGMSREKMPGQGCSNFMLLGFMPLFSLYITFTVPGGVGIYWTCSNVIAIIQTVIVNLIYNPKKIREQAEIDYEERRRLRAEAKKKQQTLADARRLDDEAERAADEAAAKAAEEAKDPANKGKKKEKKLNLEMGQVKKDENE